jgi:hypothetical protein
MVPDFGEKPGINPGLFSWLDDSQRCREKEKPTLIVNWPKTSIGESFAEPYVEKTMALIFRAWTETGGNPRRRSLNVEYSFWQIPACYFLNPVERCGSIVLVDCAVNRQVGPSQW